eukprot:gnl/TRDRNA2_/TRDRNA2_131043_c0_seq1.p2 gnl/TRDRNA2_/TRDRNA2_131043_c0~~gnl/TRDRNA2_/TRDRNA2_131043_c0_seq1.p2  ORF type:complete len:105 (+),score=11.77 gnl/TRDRNA2_/TRDRNA2_131043_c0_seq1:147-461(+)
MGMCRAAFDRGVGDGGNNKNEQTKTSRNKTAQQITNIKTKNRRAAHRRSPHHIIWQRHLTGKLVSPMRMIAGSALAVTTPHCFAQGTVRSKIGSFAEFYCSELS